VRPLRWQLPFQFDIFIWAPKGTGGKKKIPVETGISFDPPTPPRIPVFQIIFSFSEYESLRDLSNISDPDMIKGAQNHQRK
jgi:hypothetical protein